MSTDAYLRSIKPTLLTKVQANPRKAYQLVFEENGGEYDGSLNLGTTWQSLHFVLCGNPYSTVKNQLISQAILGGKNIGGEVFGLDPMRFFTSEQVSKIGEELASTEFDSLAKKRTHEEFVQLQIYQYCGNFEGEMRDVGKLYDSLRNFYEDAAAKGNAVVGYCS